MYKIIRTLSPMMMTIVILTSAIAIASIPTPRASAAQCLSAQAPSTGGHNTAIVTVTTCGAGQSSQGAAIQACRDANPDAKCSGSQTGFGAFGNVKH